MKMRRSITRDVGQALGLYSTPLILNRRDSPVLQLDWNKTLLRPNLHVTVKPCMQSLWCVGRHTPPFSFSRLALNTHSQSWPLALYGLF